MSFKDTVWSDNQKVFLSLSEFGERRDIRYDGHLFTQVPVVMSGIKHTARRQLTNDHAEGLYRSAYTLRCSIQDLGWVQPEKGTTLEVSSNANGVYRAIVTDEDGSVMTDEDGNHLMEEKPLSPGEGYFYSYRVAESAEELGMLKLILEAINE